MEPIKVKIDSYPIGESQVVTVVKEAENGVVKTLKVKVTRVEPVSKDDNGVPGQRFHWRTENERRPVEGFVALLSGESQIKLKRPGKQKSWLF